MAPDFNLVNRTSSVLQTVISGNNVNTDSTVTAGVNTQNFHLLANNDGGAFRLVNNQPAGLRVLPPWF